MEGVSNIMEPSYWVKQQVFGEMSLTLKLVIIPISKSKLCKQSDVLNDVQSLLDNAISKLGTTSVTSFYDTGLFLLEHGQKLLTV